MIQLTQQEIDAINADAKEKYPDVIKHDMWSATKLPYSKEQRSAYISAATSRQLRIKELEDALGMCRNYFEQLVGHDSYFTEPLNTEQKIIICINQALNYKP